MTHSIRVASVHDLRESKPLCVSADGKALALFHVNGKYYATDNACPHADGPLCEGAVTDGFVTCPWHGSQFNIETGDVVHGPATKNARMHPVEIRGDDVYVTLDQAAEEMKPKPAIFSFTPVFEKERPFGNEQFVNEVLQALRFPFKLYGVLPFVVISQGPDEIDAHLGEIHVTEMDLLKLSDIMKTLNAKWETAITYCLFLSTQYPGVMLLNVRGPRAPMNVDNAIRY